MPINSVCPHCYKHLRYSLKPIIYLDHYDELIHNTCYLDSTKYNKNHPIYDICGPIKAKGAIQSMIGFAHLSFISWYTLICRLPYLIYFLYLLYFTESNSTSLAKYLIKIFNIDVEIKNKDKKLDYNVVYIANHNSFYDPILLHYATRCGLVGDKNIVSLPILKSISYKLPHISIDQNKSTGTIDKMKQFVEEHGSLGIFPEGMIAHPSTLVHFANGAFLLNKTIQPILIEYDHYIHDYNLIKCFLKIVSTPKNKATITFLDPIAPNSNFEITKEKSRQSMSNYSKRLLSDVSYKDFKNAK